MLMLKGMLYLSIFLSTTTIGYLYGRRFSARLASLIFLEQCIKILETEIVYGAIPLPEALANVHRKGKKTVSYIFEDIRTELLNKKEGVYQSFLSIEDTLYEKLHLKEDDVEILLSLGRVLGSSDRQDQQKNFALILNQMSIQILESRNEKNKNEKLYKSLGVITGVGIIILLI